MKESGFVEKMSNEDERKLLHMIQDVAIELGKTVTVVKNSTDEIIVAIHNNDGTERRMGFTKLLGGKVPLGTEIPQEKLQDVVEARLRFPDDDVALAFQKTKALRKEKHP
ncbi:hypothetical protein HY967_04305 [Candidatus Jorgensenbacteria bacterium]|nr:hypothetical protein [Candidatus Jorgensenbacteria bacterium]